MIIKDFQNVIEQKKQLQKIYSDTEDVTYPTTTEYNYTTINEGYAIVMLITGNPAENDYWIAVRNAHIKGVSEENNDYWLDEAAIKLHEELFKAGINFTITIALITFHTDNKEIQAKTIQKYLKEAAEIAVWNWCYDCYEFRDNALRELLIRLKEAIEKQLEKADR